MEMWLRLAGFLALLSAVPAHADPEEPVDEAQPRRIQVTPSGTSARVVLTYRFTLDAPGSSERTLFGFPHAVVTGASITDRTGRHRMALKHADEARTEVDALLAAPAARAMASMAIVNDDLIGVSLQVITPHKGVATVELQLEAPTCIDGERRWTALPAAWVPVLHRRVAGEERAAELTRRCDSALEGETTAWLDVGPARIVAAAVDRTLKNDVARNGSELQVALREAGVWLTPINATRRVVIISDERVADRVAKIDNATLAKAFPAGTLVHVVAVAGDGDSIQRNDGSRWAGLAASTEGVAFSAGADADALSLVRPISLESVHVVEDGWIRRSGFERECEGTLDEGRSCAWWGTGAGSSVAVEGLMWNKRWRQTLELGADDITLARKLRFVLDATEPLAIAALDAAMAVSSRWSLVARWGGPGGYANEPGGGGTGWGSTCGCDDPGTIGHGSGTGSFTFVVVPLRQQLEDAVLRCKRPGVSVALTLETTLDEIVDVTATVDDAAIKTCVEEAVWNTNIRFSSPRPHEVNQLTWP